MRSRVYERGAAAETIYRAFGFETERRSHRPVEVRKTADRLSVTAFNASGYSELISADDGTLTLKTASASYGAYSITKVKGDGSVRRYAQAYQPGPRPGLIQPIPLTELEARELRAEVIEIAARILPLVARRGVSSLADYLAAVRKRSHAGPV